MSEIGMGPPVEQTGTKWQTYVILIGIIALAALFVVYASKAQYEMYEGYFLRPCEAQKLYIRVLLCRQ